MNIWGDIIRGLPGGSRIAVRPGLCGCVGCLSK